MPRTPAEALVPCYLELGGKDPMMVCADANLDRAANAAAFHSTNNKLIYGRAKRD
ncbi:MAG TPA: aldehyde dehydrogenase family protein [Solirubrobacteraceae bacterium]|nr:aldehyde dehydrogenase family protein [Solirubrobacteraceae bacterium]